MSKQLLKILIIDDSSEDRAVFRHFLQKDDEVTYSFFEAEMGAAGLELCSKQSPDCVLLDYQLPDIDGITLLAMLNPDPLLPTLPVVMMTGAGDESLAVKALKSGAQDYLAKGRITAEQLRHTIHRAIEKVAVQRELASQHQLLAESEARFFAAFHKSSAFMSIVSEAEVKYIDVNKASCELFGVARENIIGRSPAEFDFYADPAQRVALRELLNRDGYVHDFEVKWRTRSGEILIHLLNADRITVKGQPCLFVVSNDITERKQAEEKLRSSEARLKLGIEVAEFAICEIDYTNHTNHLSKEAAKLFGLGEEEITVPRETVHATFHPDDAKELAPIIAESLNPDGEGWFAREHRIVWKNGEVRWLSVRKQIFFDRTTNPPRPVRGILAARDITARKAAEELLRVSEERLNLAMTGANIGAFDWNIKTGEINWTKETEQSAAMPAEAFENSFEGFIKLIHPLDREMLQQRINAALKDGDYECEFRMLKGDGTIRWVIGKGRVFYDDKGEPARLVGVDIDITKRKLAEIELRENQRFTQNIIETAPSVIYTFNLKTGIPTYLTDQAATVLGYSFDEVRDKQPDFLRTFMHPEDAKSAQKHFRQLSQTSNGKIFEFEYRMQHKSGEWRWFRSRDRVFKRDENGTAEEILGIALDVTERKKAADEVRENEERMRLATEATAVGIWEWNVITNQIRWDARMFRIYGIAPTEGGIVPYTAWSESVLAEELSRQEELLQETVRQGGQSSREFRIRRNDDGAIRYVQAVETVRLNDDGQPEWVIGTNLDITERIQRERNLAFLADLHKDFAPLLNADEILRVAGERIAAYLNLTNCSFVEINEAMDTAHVVHDQHAAGAVNLAGVYPMKDFHSAEERAEMLAGRAIVINDTGAMREPEAAARFDALGIRALLTAPYVSDGRWRFCLCAMRDKSGIWSESEVELLTEIAARIYTRIERARAEEKLRISEERFRRLFESAKDGILILNPDTARIVDANPYIAELLGYSPAELIGKELWEIGLFKDIEKSKAAVQELQEKKYIRYEDLPLETKSGRRINVEFVSNGYAEGDETVIQCNIRDITERKIAEQRLRDEEERFRLLTENAKDYAIIFIDKEMRITHWNTGAEQILGWTEKEIIGQSVALIFTPEDQINKIPEKEIAIAKEKGQARDERWHLRKDDSRFYGFGEMIALRDETGNLRGFAKLFRDLTEKKQAENRLRESEEKFRAIFDSIDEGFCIIEMIFDENQKPIDYRFVQANPAMERLTGLKDAIGKTARELIPDLEELWFEAYGKVVLTGEPIRFQNYAESMNRWFDVYASRIGDESSNRVAIVFNNITERKKSEESLQKSEAEFRTLANAVPQIVWVTGAGGVMEFVNEQWTEFSGLDLAATDTPEIVNEVIHPDDRVLMNEEWRKAFAEGKGFEFEARMRNQKTKEYHWFLVKSEPSRDSQGNIQKWFGTSTDITVNKDAALKLRDSEERLELAVSATQLGIWDANLITGESYWSRRNYRIHGISSEIVITPEFINSEIIHPEDLPDWRAAIRDAINPEGNGLLKFEHRTIWPDGTERWVSVQGRAHFAEVGGFLRAIRLAGSTLDITQQKQFEAAREHLLVEEQHLREIAESHNRAKDEFLAVVSHELRNPLNAILGYTHILRLNPHDADKVTNHTEIIERSARMQQKLIEDLLDTARIISGKLKIETIPVDLHLMIEDALTVVRPAAQAKRIKLITQIEHKLQNIIGDSSRLQQIIWNLLQNAIKFTPEGGRVELKTEFSEEHIHIIIKDSGQGIKPEFLSSVFDRFSQDDMARTRRHGGLGLGLALVKQLVELHGGKIEVQSAGVGMGATFIVTLPLHVTQFAEQSTPIPAISEVYNDSGVIPLKDLPRLDGVHVLVLDDQEEARLMVAATLKEQGATVTVADTGMAAREFLAAHEFDIFICDVAMPDEDGYEVIGKIRALENQRGAARSQRLPAVALTALARPEDRLQALNAGFQMHVAKPVELAELIMVIVSLTQNRQRNKVEP